MAISKRLKLIAGLVTKGSVAADIGTDHALVPVYLLKENIAVKVIASDKSSACLEKAKEAAKKYFPDGRLQTRLSDGLLGLKPYEVDSVIISGMGGILICRILDEGKEVAESVKELILSPHRDVELVRNRLDVMGFDIVFDEIITDKKKEYCVIKALNSRFSLKETL